MKIWKVEDTDFIDIFISTKTVEIRVRFFSKKPHNTYSECCEAVKKPTNLASFFTVNRPHSVEELIDLLSVDLSKSEIDTITQCMQKVF